MTVRQWNETIYQIKVPLPFPLRWVNSYLIRGRSGWTVIDPGLHSEESERVWEEARERIGFAWPDVERIVLTHHHPDHYGMSGWLQERSKAPVYISRLGMEQAQAFWGEGGTMNRRMLELFRRHGTDADTLAQLESHMERFLPQVSPQPTLTVIEPDKPFPLGDRSFSVIHTPGHAAGHYCFYDPEQKEMFCGDHVLPTITPNVSYIPGIDPDPLGSYIQSLEHVKTVDVRAAYPGHREPFSAFAERAAEIVRHHHDRLDRMCAELTDPLDAFRLCRRLFGDRLSIHQLRFALSETIAHLLYLVETGRIRQSERDDGVIVYASGR